MVKRGWARGAVLVAGLLATLVVGPSHAVAGTPRATGTEGAEQQLAQTYAPVVRLVTQHEPCGPGEPYRPSAVDPLFGDSSVALRGPWTQHDLVKVGPTAADLSAGLDDYALDFPGNPLEPGCGYETWVHRLWAKSPPTVYAHVAREAGHDDRLALQYWFYYPFNDYNNKHESDWEFVQLEFGTGDVTRALDDGPERAVYSQHEGSDQAVWASDGMQVEDGTHPVVYVSAGSHANKFSAGVFMGNSAEAGFGCDSTAGDHVDVRPDVATIPSDRTAARQEFPWIAYRGHWGQTGSVSFYNGPTGPNRKRAWTRPFTWSDDARASSIMIPGSEVAASGPAQVYCNAVGKGSDLFRHFTDRPGTVLLVLGGLLALVWWLVRQTEWRTSALPLRRRRSAGQVVHASWEMFASRPFLFLAISLPLLVCAVAAALTGTWSLRAGPNGWLPAIFYGLELLAMLGATAATVRAVQQVDAGTSPTPSTAYRQSWRRALAALVPMAVAVVAIFLTASSLVLLPVALLLVAGWVLVVPIVVVEDDRPPISALWRSLHLSWGNVRTIVPVALLGAVLATTVGAFLGALLFAVYPAPFIVLNVLPPLTFALLWPFVAIAATYLYGSAVAADTREDASPSRVRTGG